MAVKCLEEFNPWPSFVDIFSSVILVLLLFLLITIVNLGYYAQFKFKVSYSGNIATKVLLEDSDVEAVKTKDKDKEKIKEKIKKILKKEKDKKKKKHILNIKQKIKDEIIPIISKKPIISAGEKIINDNRDKIEDTNQKFNNKVMIVQYDNNKFKVNDTELNRIHKFISNARKKYPNYIIELSSIDTINNVSKTLSKELSLSRLIGIKNLMKKLNYKTEEIKINLNKYTKIPKGLSSKNIENGVIIITLVNK